LFHATGHRLQTADVANSRQNSVVVECLTQRRFYTNAVLRGYNRRLGRYSRRQIAHERQTVSRGGFVGAHHVVKRHVGHLARRANDAVGYECAVAPDLGCQVYAFLADGIVVGAAYHGEPGTWVLRQSPS
jgi:hypothetical protein